MKQKRYIFGLFLLMSSLNLWAATIINLPTEVVVHCSGAGSYIWHDSAYSASGTYYDTIWKTTPDSTGYVYTLKFTWTDHFETNTILYLEKGKTLEYKGLIFTKPGTQTIRTSSAEYPDCYTLERVTVYYKTYWEITENQHLCGDTILYWHGKYLDRSGQYRAESGDTTYILNLTITQEPPVIRDTAHTCEVVIPFKWRMLEINHPCDTFTIIPNKTGGCDTLATLHYFVTTRRDTTFLPDSIVCGSIPYYFHGKKYYGDNTLADVEKSQYGCDSIVARRYISIPGTFFFLNDTNDFKKNPKYHWVARSKDYDKPGLYYDSVPNAGCQIWYQLKLGSILHDTIDCCKGEKPMYEGIEITHDTMVTEITYTDEGWMELVEHHHYIFHAKNNTSFPPVQICHNGSYTWYYDLSDSTKFMVITEKEGATMAGKTFTKQLGDNRCNTASIKVTVSRYQDNGTKTVVRSLATCQDRDTFFVRPSTKDTVKVQQYDFGTLTYRDTIRSIYGCDSIYSRFDFVCTPKVSKLDSIFYCSAPDPIHINGKAYHYTGVFEQIIGNDSIYRFEIVDYRGPTRHDETLVGCYLTDPAASKYGNNYYTSGEDTIYLPFHQNSREQCDSAIIYLHIRVPQRRHDTIYTGFCDNSFFVLPYLKDTIYNPGIYFDTITDGTGCDSIVPYSLTRWKTHRSTTSICAFPENLPVSWRRSDGTDTLIYTPGSYTSTFHTLNGCDSIAALHLLPITPFHFYDTATICNNESYIWHGDTLSQACDTTHYYKTRRCGIDSIYHLHLMVTDTIKTLNYIPLWKGSSYYYCQWKLTLNDTNKIYSYKTVRKLTGCDSIDQVRIIPATAQHIHLYPCEHDVVIINGQTITKDSVYFERLDRPQGGDSVMYKHVHFVRVTRSDTTVQRYPKDLPYVWRGQTLTAYGTYRDTVRSTNFNLDSLHCDSIIYSLRLISPIVPVKDTTIYVCTDNLPFKHKQLYYNPTTDTTIVDTLRSGLTDTLYVNNHYILVSIYSDTVRYHICPGDSQLVDTLYFKERGYYTLHYRNRQGLDSIYRFSIEILPHYETTVRLGDTSRIYCDTLRYKGYTIPYQEGADTGLIFTEYLHTIHGCDSIVHLKMKIFKSRQNKLDVTYPRGDKFVYNLKEYSTDTTDIRRLTSAQGCDSVEYLTVRFYDTNDKKYNYLACGGDTIYILGKPVVIPTTKADTMINDTTTEQEITYIKRIHVKIGNPFAVQRKPELCDKQVRADKQVTFQTAYEITSLTNSHPDYYDIHFIDNDIEVIPMDTTYSIGDTATIFPITMKLKDDGCIFPGDYTYTITFRSSACLRCNKTDTNTISVYYPSDIMEARWNHFVALSPHSTSTQCDWDLVPPFYWFINDQPMVSESDPTQLYFTSSYLNAGDKVSVKVTRRSYSLPVWSYSMIFQPLQPQIGTNGKPQIIVTPTAVPKRGAVHIQTLSQGSYQLYNATGYLCSQGALTDGITTFEMPGATGFYLLHITLQDGTTTTERLIAY